MDHTRFLNIQSCTHPEAVRDFLRLSRRISDDGVGSNLSERSCGEYLPRMYNEWRKRDDILAYCGSLAGASAHEYTPDNTDAISSLSKRAREHIEFAHTKTDPRIDAYTARDEASSSKISPSDSQDVLSWVRQEKAAEDIIRDSTVNVVARRCGGLGVQAQEFLRY